MQKNSFHVIFSKNIYLIKRRAASIAIYPFQRKEKILNKLRSGGQITISEDSKLFGVSSSTLHRDLEELEKQGLVKKMRGGAILSEAFRFETHFDIRMKTNVEEKEEIARKAMETIKDDSSIFLDHSTAIAFLARELKRGHFRNLIVLTNSLVIPLELAGERGIQVMLTGGVVQSEFKALSGRWVMESLQRLNIQQIFASVGAISVEFGLMTQTPFIHEMLLELFLNKSQINILADSSKFFKIGAFQVAPLNPSFTIFTSKKLPTDIRSRIERKGIKVIS